MLAVYCLTPGPLITHCHICYFDSNLCCSNSLSFFKAFILISISASVVHCYAILSYGATLWLSWFIALLSPQDQASKDKALQNMASLSSAQIVSPSIIKNHLPPLPPAPYQPARVSPQFSSRTAAFACSCENVILSFLVLASHARTAWTLSGVSKPMFDQQWVTLYTHFSYGEKNKVFCFVN